MEIKRHDTFFQWRKERRLAPILLEVLEIIEDREGYRGIYKVRWQILETDKIYPSTFLMAVDNNGVFYEFVPIPHKVYCQAMKILKETSNYKNARRRILYLIKKEITL